MNPNPQLISQTLEEVTLAPFDFETTATAHGWVMLRPFEWQAATAELSRVHRLSGGPVVRLRLRAGQHNPAPVVQIDVESADPLAPAEEAEIRHAGRRMLRLDEDLSDFYHLADRMNGWQLRLRPGGGRLLRCPTLFEDILYTLCTTNIAWSGTIRMVDRLTTHLGESFPDVPEWQAFPTPAAVASAGAEFLRQETGLGYRSSYVWELAAAVIEGRLDLARLEDPTLPTETLQDELRQLKGVGPYAAATLLMILGRYDTLAIDTELRAHVSRKYFDGQPASEAQIRSIYAPWGAWQYLAYWFDPPG
jgi:3-methyladenine DNA glycosylase/8-oxoguanine DNA glycosylase